MKNKFTDNQEIIILDAWEHSPLTMSSLFDICLKKTNTHIIVDCCKESELISGFHYGRIRTSGVNEDAEMQKKTILWNVEHNNRLSLIHGNYKIIPEDSINVSDILVPGFGGISVNNVHNILQYVSGISSAIIGGFFDDVEIWPTYFMVWPGAKVAGEALKNAVKWNDNRSIDTMFMIKNRVPKPHRMLLLDELSKRDVLEDNMYSQYEQHPGEIASTMKAIGATHYHGKTHAIGRPLTDEEDWYALPPYGQDDVLIEVVAETHIDRPFYTEKTVWPLVYMKPFMIMGSHLMNHNLTKYGFKLYDEFIDYSFDKIESPKKRIIAMADELARLSNLKLSNIEYHKLNEKLRPKIEHNLAVYLEMVFNDPYLPKIIKEFGNDPKYSQPPNQDMTIISPQNGSWKTYTDRNGGNGVLMDIVRHNPYLQKLMGRLL